MSPVLSPPRMFSGPTGQLPQILTGIGYFTAVELGLVLPETRTVAQGERFFPTIVWVPGLNRWQVRIGVTVVAPGELWLTTYRIDPRDAVTQLPTTGVVPRIVLQGVASDGIFTFGRDGTAGTSLEHNADPNWLTQLSWRNGGGGGTVTVNDFRLWIGTN